MSSLPSARSAAFHMDDRDAEKAGGGVEAVDAVHHFARAGRRTRTVRRIRKVALMQIDRDDRGVRDGGEFLEAPRQGPSFAVNKCVHASLPADNPRDLAVGPTVSHCVQPCPRHTPKWAMRDGRASISENVIQERLRNFNKYNIFE